MSNLSRCELTRRVVTRPAQPLWAIGPLGHWASPLARAQAWPGKPAALIAPFPPGGGVDTVARVKGERLATRLRQPVNTDSKPGAGAPLGAAALARSARDGYTLMVASRNRSPVLPEVPTMAEAGLTGRETATNDTLIVPAKTPADAVSRHNRDVNAVRRMPEVVDKLTALGIVFTGGRTEAAVTRITAELAK